MAIVGPRPLLVSYLPWYTEIEKHRHDVRSGLTGLAQVNGRNFLDWDHRLAMDVEYVQDITYDSILCCDAGSTCIDRAGLEPCNGLLDSLFTICYIFGSDELV